MRLTPLPSFPTSLRQNSETSPSLTQTKMAARNRWLFMRPVAVSGLRKSLAFVKVTVFTCRVHLLNICDLSSGSDSGVLTECKQDIVTAGMPFKGSSSAFELVCAVRCILFLQSLSALLLYATTTRSSCCTGT